MRRASIRDALNFVSYVCHTCVIPPQKQTLSYDFEKVKTLENIEFSRVLRLCVFISLRTEGHVSLP